MNLEVARKIERQMIEDAMEKKEMGSRILVMGTQLGMLKAGLKMSLELIEAMSEKRLNIVGGKMIVFDLDESFDAPVQKLEDLINLLKSCMEDIDNISRHQSIGVSENQIDEDIVDMTNLFASWCSKSPSKPKFKFTLFWKDGKREILEGYDFSHALNSAGYGNGALAALDFHALGDNKEYYWDKGEHNWKRKDKINP